MIFDKCLKLLDYNVNSIEQYIIDCSGVVEWRSPFVLGLQIFIFIAAAAVFGGFIYWRISR